MSLRIAYFGSDAFSVVLLRRLVENRRRLGIASIDVITRSIKPTGRNRKRFVDVPVGAYAHDTGLPVHRADSSADIVGLQQEFDLAVAVSYGKLIPHQFLARVRYGGLNVHPSLLPMYSGSSPIQYALMNDNPFTGVSVQTLHPTKFDRGDLLAQSGPIPIEDSDNYASLVPKLGEVGLHLLEETISTKRYLGEPLPAQYPFSLAGKISPTMRQADWHKPARTIRRLYDALGSIYTFVSVKGQVLRLILSGVSDGPNLSLEPGHFTLDADKLAVGTGSGTLFATRVKLQYCAEESPAKFLPRVDTTSFND